MTEEQRKAMADYKHARQQYEWMQQRRDNYDGNNPDKYATGTKSARRLYEIRRYTLESLGVDLETVDQEYEREREEEQQRWAPKSNAE